MNNKRDGTGPLTIRKVAKFFDITARSLRFYEEKGLLNPERRGSQRRCIVSVTGDGY